MTKRIHPKAAKYRTTNTWSRSVLFWLALGASAVVLGTGRRGFNLCGETGCFRIHRDSDQRADLLGFTVEPTDGAVSASDANSKVAEADIAKATTTNDINDPLNFIRGTDRVFVTFGNAAYWDLIHNWVVSVKKTGIPFIVAVLDDQTETLCKQAGYPHWSPKLVNQANTSTTSANFRTQFGLFRSMGAKKVGLVLALLEEYDVGIVTVSDADVTWMKDPTDYYAQHPTADWFLSTDCLSAKVEEAWKPVHLQPRCGHIPGNHWGRAFNSGLFAVRNTPMGKLLLHHWVAFLQDSTREEITLTQNEQKKIFHVTDQLALNLIFDQAVRANTGMLKAAPENHRLVLVNALDINTSYTAEAGSPLLPHVRIHPLPVLLFANGHVAFIQRLPQERHIMPYAVHATFQNGYTGFQLQHKRERFRDLFMWNIDTDDYYKGAQPDDKWLDTPCNGKFLVYDNTVAEAVEQIDAARSVYKDSLPIFYKHWIAGSYQLAVLRDALALARMLGRILILPKLMSWCDLDYTPDIITDCIVRGTDSHFPLFPPADHLVQIPLFERNNVPFRTSSFLEHPRTPSEIKTSYADVLVGNGADAGAKLWPGIKQDEIVRTLEPFKDVRVLRIKNLRPGLIRSFTKPEDTAAFNKLQQALTIDLDWCCATTHPNRTRRAFSYALPAPLSDDWQPWTPPKLQRPDYCEDPTWDNDNKLWLNVTNHPCTFLKGVR